MVERFIIYGDADFEAGVKLESMKIRGAARLEKECWIETIQNAGECQVSEHLVCNRLTSYGALEGKGHVKVNTLLSYGEIATTGELEGEFLNIKGEIQNANLINGEEIILELHSNCHIEEIGATKLVVKQAKRNKIHCCLSAKQIEGDDLDVSYTKADNIRGQIVRIGKHCVIESVEYSDSLSVDPTANIKQQVRN